MSKEYIERPSLMGKLTSSETQNAMREMDGSQAYSFFLAMVNSESPADVVEVKHGRWKWKRFGCVECSLCHKENNIRKFPYCSNCGAKMDGE